MINVPIVVNYAMLQRLEAVLLVFKDQHDWLIPRNNFSLTLAQIDSLLNEVRKELHTPCVTIATLEVGHFSPGVLPEHIHDRLTMMDDMAQILSDIFITPENIQEEVKRSYG